MKRLLSLILLIQLTWSQDDSTNVQIIEGVADSVSIDSLAQTDNATEIEEDVAVLDPSIPLTLDVGYKGFLWGSGHNKKIFTSYFIKILRTANYITSHLRGVKKLRKDDRIKLAMNF